MATRTSIYTLVPSTFSTKQPKCHCCCQLTTSGSQRSNSSPCGDSEKTIIDWSTMPVSRVRNVDFPYSSDNNSAFATDSLDEHKRRLLSPDYPVRKELITLAGNYFYKSIPFIAQPLQFYRRLSCALIIGALVTSTILTLTAILLVYHVHYASHETHDAAGYPKTSLFNQPPPTEIVTMHPIKRRIVINDAHFTDLHKSTQVAQVKHFTTPPKLTTTKKIEENLPSDYMAGSDDEYGDANEIPVEEIMKAKFFVEKEEGCGPNTFGKICQQCKCPLPNQLCNKRTGECTCQPGWTGPKCDVPNEPIIRPTRGDFVAQIN